MNSKIHCGRPARAKTVLALSLAFSCSWLAISKANAARCLFISSYHKGYAWSDGVERGIRQTLAKKCELRQYDMDTKRFKTKADKIERGLQAKKIIESWQPDVVITADDNAAKYVVQRYYKNHSLPFVFSGVNWSAKEYGFPYPNVTGMIEVAPITRMLQEAQTIIPASQKIFYLGANTRTEKKNLKRVTEAAEALGLQVQGRLVEYQSEWIGAFQQAQTYDFIVVGSYSGINDWDPAKAGKAAAKLGGKLTVTNHRWMMPYAILGMTKIPEEHGQWAGKVALAILDGARPSDIPIVANRRWDLWVNKTLLDAAHIRLPSKLAEHAKSFLEK